MSTSPFQFRRQLGSGFLAALHALLDDPHGQWWRDVLTHPDLVLAVRDESLNVYHRGASLFRVTVRDDAVAAETHAKYLVRQQQAYATLTPDGHFVLPAPALWPAYAGAATLREMIAAARGLAGVEKTGLHALIAGHPRVIDVEVAFRSLPPHGGTQASGEPVPDADAGDLTTTGDSADATAAPPDSPRQDRLDAVTLEERDGALWLAFHEAKYFTNPELRAGPQRTPPVADQIARYRSSLQHYAPDIAASYGAVCRALVTLAAMRSQARQVTGGPTDVATVDPDPLIQRAAAGEVLHVDPEPRLIVFGFDQDQRDGPVWTRHRERLAELGLTVHAVGNPKMAGMGAFTYRGT